tara:strand:- start:188 stop:664 length:477 start_codon:yes stop_codon:yes gene_type:complete
MNTSIEEWLDKYGESHQNKTNKLIHWFCVPIITFTLLGLLSLVSYTFIIYNQAITINVAWVLIIIAILFYLKLSYSLTIGMFIFSGTCLWLINTLTNTYLPTELLKYYIIAFILAWIGQFIGHKIEGKKPSFFDDIQFLLIGPAWLLSFIYKKYNISL